MLTVVIIKQEDKEANLLGICDGFDNLAGYNLLSYKSKREALNFWAIEELIAIPIRLWVILTYKKRGHPQFLTSTFFAANKRL